ncbi:SCP2 sterol-binding domain-containing protein [Ottowia sp.]|uniref:SCP2 sterol-binding domain-containing protein n=1 Tax=Ottowia sp. TaxID=1898956 RepID=UPI003A8823AA
MATPTPFSLLADALGKAASHFKAPHWIVHEAQHRLVLVLNHVLMQEPEAQARLARQKGQVVRLQWRDFQMQLAATPAGLCELAPQATPDLLLTVAEASPLGLARQAMLGDKPEVRIEGDVQLAADINWLVDHVRWDAEEDLARLIGDAPAHALAQTLQRAAQGLRGFVAQFLRQDQAQR